jgi:divalent metal cation (Fe/Co/Zn/Cd) transporter
MKELYLFSTVVSVLIVVVGVVLLCYLLKRKNEGTHSALNYVILIGAVILLLIGFKFISLLFPLYLAA